MVNQIKRVMKKLSIEEKAKHYDYAIERAKMCLKDGGITNTAISYIEDILPELKKNEDEEIKDTLIEYFKERQKNGDWDELFCGLSYNDIIAWFEKQGEPADKGEISDGYHTFNELYYYRMLYNAAFFNLLPKNLVHKSKKHHDGEECFGGGWFIVMANLPTGQISNHYELKYWDLFTIPEKEFADKWDGHTPQEAAERLHKYLLEKQGEQPKQEWTEEDEKILEDIKFNFTYNKEKMTDALIAQYNHFFDKIKSLKPQPKQEWSQDDERLRKTTISFLKDFADKGYENAIECMNWLEKKGEQNLIEIHPISKVGDYIRNKECMDWLEKKGEQKVPINDFKAKDWYVSKVDGKIRNIYHSVDKVKPKFEVGDWVVNTITNNVEQIIKVTNNEYDCSGNLIVSFDNQHLLRKWTNQDAKDGDILITVTDKAPFIFKGFIDKFHPNCPVAYGGIINEGSFDISYGEGWWDDDDIKPANEEQRNFLFQKIKEAGYEWDAENKKFIDLKYN